MVKKKNENIHHNTKSEVKQKAFLDHIRKPNTDNILITENL